MNASIKIFLVSLMLNTTSSFAQLQTNLTVDDFKDLTPILKDDPELFCKEFERFKIGFFPTSEIINEFKKLGMPDTVLECLRNNFPENLKFHVIQFECLSPNCGKWITKDLSVETREAIFDQKESNIAFRRFARKEIAGYIKEKASFEDNELPTVYLTGIVHERDSNFIAVIRLKYQNKFTAGGQRIAGSDFEFKSTSREDVEEGCKKIAFWALKQIEEEIN